jgi:hypothetical protein
VLPLCAAQARAAKRRTQRVSAANFNVKKPDEDVEADRERGMVTPWCRKLSEGP